MPQGVVGSRGAVHGECHEGFGTVEGRRELVGDSQEKSLRRQLLCQASVNNNNKPGRLKWWAIDELHLQSPDIARTADSNLRGDYSNRSDKRNQKMPGSSAMESVSYLSLSKRYVKQRQEMVRIKLQIVCLARQLTVFGSALPLE